MLVCLFDCLVVVDLCGALLGHVFSVSPCDRVSVCRGEYVYVCVSALA